MSQTIDTQLLRETESISNETQQNKDLSQDQNENVGVTTRARKREREERNQQMNKSPDQPTGSDNHAEELPNENCPICLEDFNDKKVGNPENCKHIFCLDCIMHWSKKNNSCPIDRKIFNKIYKRKSFKSTKSFGSVKVKDNRQELQLENDFLEMINDDISCRICGRDDHEETLLICDECDNGYHTFCLELPGIPEEDEWLCPLCQVDRMSAAEDLYEASDLEELQDIIQNMHEEEMEHAQNGAETRPRRAPAIPRRRTRTARNQRAPGVRTRRQRTNRTANSAPTTRRQRIRAQQERERRRHRINRAINRRIETVNTANQNPTATTTNNSQQAVIRNERPRLNVLQSEPVPLEEAEQSSYVAINRALISHSEAARRIAASGIQIPQRRTPERSISLQLSIRQNNSSLNRVSSQPIRSNRVAEVPRIPISQLPRIQRRNDVPSQSTSNSNSSRPARSNTSFLDNLLNTQARLHNPNNFRVRGANIEIS